MIKEKEMVYETISEKFLSGVKSMMGAIVEWLRGV